MSIASSFLKISERLQCFLTQRLLRQAFRNGPARFGDPDTKRKTRKMNEALHLHILASQEELSILAREFPGQIFQGHHVKCPECWKYYMDLKQRYCGG